MSASKSLANLFDNLIKNSANVFVPIAMGALKLSAVGLTVPDRRSKKKL